MLNLPSFFKSKKDSDKFLTININSNVVRCLAFYHDGNDMRIIGSGESFMEPGSFRGGVPVDIQNVSDALTNAINKALENVEEDVSNVIVGTTGTVCIDTMTTVRIKRSKTPITKKELDKTYGRIAEISSMQAQSQYVEITGNEDTTLDLITTSNVYIKLDDVKVNEIEGQIASLVELAVFSAHVPSFYLESVNSVMKNAKLNILAICSGMYALVKSLTLSATDLNDFVIINISEDSTEVSVVFGKGILTTRSLDIGTNQFVEGISQEMGLTMREAQKVLSGYISKNLTQSESIIVQKCLQNTLEIWLTGLELLFSEYTGVKTFASKVIITGKGSNIPDLWDIIKNEPWTKNIPFKAPPSFEKATFLDFAKITDATGKVAEAEWLNTASLSVAYLEMKGLTND